MTQIPENIYARLGEIIKDALTDGDSIALPSFGTLSTVKTDEHVDVDPVTHVKMLVPPKITVQFTPALKLVKQIKGRKEGTHE